MKNKTFALIALVMVLSGCGGKTVYVWDMTDIIGLWIVGIVIVIAIIIFIYAWVSDKINSWRQKFSKRK